MTKQKPRNSKKKKVTKTSPTRSPIRSTKKGRGGRSLSTAKASQELQLKSKEKPGRQLSSASLRKHTRPTKTALSGSVAQAHALQKLLKEDVKTWTRLLFGIDLWGEPLDNKSQCSIVHSVIHNRRTTVKGCVASGKTAAAGVAVHAFLQAYPYSKVLATAPSHRQVEKALWAEVKTNYYRAKNRGIDLGGEMKPAATELIIDRERDWYALGFATDDPQRIHGFHGGGQKMLIIVDEAQGMDIATLEAIENVMSDGLAHLLLLQNPSSLIGEAYDSFNRKASIYNRITISAYDTPNFTIGKGALPGLADPDQVEEWIKLLGKDSNFCLIKVFATFPRQESDSLIPLDWVEAAHKRTPKRGTSTKERGTAVDVARFGGDNSVIQPFDGLHIPKADAYNGMDTMELVGRNRVKLREMESRLTLYDVIGMGGGPVDRHRELTSPIDNVIAINVAEKARNDKKFANLRSELFWQVREALDPENPNAISMEEVPERTEELVAIKYRINSRGQIEVESKEKLKSPKRLGRSTDYADALKFAVEGMRIAGVDDDTEPAVEGPTSGLEKDVDDFMQGEESEGAEAGFE